MTTVTYDGGPTFVPDVVSIETMETTSDRRTVTHDILDGPPVHTLRPASASSGTLVFAFYDETTAWDCYEAHRLAAVFRVTDDLPSRSFAYVLGNGRLTIQLDPDTAGFWLVSIPYEVVT